MTDALSPRRTARTALLRLLPWGLYALFCLGAALYLRYGLIENTPVGLACQAALEQGASTQDGGGPFHCGPRLALIEFNMMSGWAYAALIGAALALISRGRAWLSLGLVLGLGAGAMGLVLYNAGPAAAGFILSLAVLLRRG